MSHMGHLTAHLIFLITISTLGPFQYGLHLAELNAPQDMIQCGVTTLSGETATAKKFALSRCIHMNEAEFAFLSSVYILGGFIGAVTAGPGSSRYGRLLAMRLTSIFFTIGSLVETFAGSVIMMSTGRFLAGIGAGASTVVIPLYISEISPPKARGLFGTMTQAMICMGILTTQGLGYIFSKDAQWRVILGFGAGLGVTNAIGLIFIPESPAWLAANNNPNLAVTILQRIRGASYPIYQEIASWNLQKDIVTEEDPLLNPPITNPVLENGSCSTAIINPGKTVAPLVGVIGVLRDPHYRPAIIAVIGVMSAQQLCGVNSINMYSVSLLRGLLPISSLLLTILITIMNLVTTLLCAPLADRIGRKSCLILSITGMGIMALLLATSLLLEIKLLSSVAVILFVVFFATGLGPVPFMIASELVGQEAVGATQSWCLAGNYFSTYIVAQFFPLLNSWMNAKWGGVGWVYFVFAALAGISLAFVVYFVPETKDMTGPDEVWSRFRETKGRAES